MTLTIYHNPRCSKSRKTLELIRDAGQEPVIVEYLKTPPDAADLREIIERLGIAPRALLRKGEAEFKAMGLSDESLKDETLIEAMVMAPKLIERPIVVDGTRAVLGRPPENVLKLL